MTQINCIEGIKCPACDEDIEEQVEDYMDDPNSGGLPFECCECGRLLQLETGGFHWRVYLVDE